MGGRGQGGAEVRRRSVRGARLDRGTGGSERPGRGRAQPRGVDRERVDRRGRPHRAHGVATGHALRAGVRTGLGRLRDRGGRCDRRHGEDPERRLQVRRGQDADVRAGTGGQERERDGPSRPGDRDRRDDLGHALEPEARAPGRHRPRARDDRRRRRDGVQPDLGRRRHRRRRRPYQAHRAVQGDTHGTGRRSGHRRLLRGTGHRDGELRQRSAPGGHRRPGPPRPDQDVDVQGASGLQGRVRGHLPGRRDGRRRDVRGRALQRERPRDARPDHRHRHHCRRRTRRLGAVGMGIGRQRTDSERRAGLEHAELAVPRRLGLGPGRDGDGPHGRDQDGRDALDLGQQPPRPVGARQCWEQHRTNGADAGRYRHQLGRDQRR